MRARLQYVAGQGWHCGRLLLWPALLGAALLGSFAVGPLQSALQAVLHVRLPFGLAVPLGIGLLVARRLRRKLAGEPFTYDPLEADTVRDWETRQINRTDDPVLFRRLYQFELFMWGSSLALLGGLLVLASLP
ncbi:MAG: hypothetical protein OEW17_09375 [Gemmatimonadota bacterium]|nr:hypothetical protein [Gemmatimonadota bacterium]MDH4349005.1 hypothetical protein [Gemmatimonadota bacterium]MDH5283405.1 hypothetical protein [Gemmatimonadota bacterium]